MDTIWSDCATAFPSTSRLPTHEPPGAPLRSISPASESTTPIQTGAGTGVRKAASAINGVKTT